MPAEAETLGASAAVVIRGATADPALAVGVGVLIGVVSGLWSVMLLLWFTTSAKRGRSKRLRIALGECLSLPTFWFGGPWLSGRLMSIDQLNTSMGYYVLTLSAVFLVITGLPIFRLVVRTADAVRGFE